MVFGGLVLLADWFINLFSVFLFLVQLDGRSMLLESGRYMETIGA